MKLLNSEETSSDDTLEDARLRDIEVERKRRDGDESCEPQEMEDEDVEMKPVEETSDIELVEKHIRGLCLEFLRTASLLKYYLYSIKLPVITNAEDECSALENYLGVGEMFSVCDGEVMAAMRLEIQVAVSEWRMPLVNFANVSKEAVSVTLRRELYCKPSLMKLPKIYEFLMT